jgi:hypothetical protein
MIDPLQISVVVQCDVVHAFTVFTEKASMWWPQTHSVSREPGLTVTFEPKVGGRIFERTAGSTEFDWARSSCGIHPTAWAISGTFGRIAPRLPKSRFASWPSQTARRGWTSSTRGGTVWVIHASLGETPTRRGGAGCCLTSSRPVRDLWNDAQRGVGRRVASLRRWE